MDRLSSLRLGVFGGTFDPPHNGHLRLAGEALNDLRLDRLLWVITPDPPHKHSRMITPLPVRLRMLEAALDGMADNEISLVDVNRPGPQYAVDTIRLLRAQYPDAELIYLMGGDSLRDLPTWHQPIELLAEINELGILRRPSDDVNLEKLELQLPGIKEKLRYIRTWRTALSSTRVREMVLRGKPIDALVPPAVMEIIRSEKLYLKPERVDRAVRSPHRHKNQSSA